MRLRDATYAAIDIETTGIHFTTDRICEIGIVVVKLGKKRVEFGTLVNPEHPISKNSFAVHGITDEMVKDAPKFYEIADKVEDLLREAVIVGHNLTSIDISFLNKELRNAGRKPLFNTFIDTYRLAKRLFPGLKRNSLSNLAMELGIKVGTIHRALPDAQLAMKIWLKILERFRRAGIETFEDLREMGLLNGKIKAKARRIFELAKDTGLVKIVYQSPYSGRTERVIEPLAARGGKLDAYCHLRDDFRSFDLNRIIKVEPVNG